MHTPQEAVAELEHAVNELNFTLVLLAGYARRPLPNGAGSRLDVFGLDSAADYDQVWATCDRLRVAPVFHSSLQSVHPARAISNYVFNHIGGSPGPTRLFVRPSFWEGSTGASRGCASATSKVASCGEPACSPT